MQFITSINYTYSSNLYTIMKILNRLEEEYNILACDFEAASRWTDAEKENMKTFLKSDINITKEEKRQIQQYIDSDGLSHPSLIYITHLSVAWSPTEAFIAILPTDQHRKMICKWLVTTSCKQIWHNLSFDGKLIYYHTKKLPKNYEDTEILSKTLLNHVNTFEAKTGLKHLMGYKYGDWAVSKDSFNLSEMYDETLIKYAGIDACATYSLWNEIQNTLKETDE